MAEFEDFANANGAGAVLVTALLMSPPGRRLLRRGAVYGIAGLLMAKDAAAFTRGVGRGFRQTAGNVANGISQVAPSPQEPVSGVGGQN